MPAVDLSSGLQMRHRERGIGASAVFLHPPLLDGTVWLDQLQALSDIRRCFAVDLIGHGLSDPNPHPVYKPSDHAADLQAWIAAAAPEGPLDLVGLGVGGVIASLVCAARLSRIRSLTLICTTFAGPQTPTEARAHEEFARMAVVEEREILFHRLTQDDMAPDASLMARARYRSMLHRTPVESLVQVLNGKSAEAHADLPGKLNLPVLAIVTGSHDFSGELGAVRGLRTARIGAAGAVPPLEDPVQVGAALRRHWLQASPPPASGLGRASRRSVRP